ncbi:MAG: hypothetical protein GX992_10010 [Clostridium sp.]|nr:hypothetical protein [Clostridium sp.]
MHITVSLLARKTGEIKDFLQRFYQRDVKMDRDVQQWIYVYNKPLEAIDVITTAIDNNDKHEMVVFVQVDEGDIHAVTCENCNDIVKAIFYLYHNETQVAT